MMKTPIALISIGLLGSALTAVGVTGYLAWTSLTGEAELRPIAQSDPSPQPLVSSAPIAQPVAAVSSSVTAPPTQPTVTPWTQAENDYLFDLSQALQSTEQQRLSPAEQLDIGHKIQSWLESGADYWGVREQFDGAYQGALAGDYAHNREVYIKFATQRFAPNHVATLMQPSTNVEASYRAPDRTPTPVPNPRSGGPFAPPDGMPFEQPYEVPYEIPYDAPFGVPFEGPFEGPFEAPFEGPMAGPIPGPVPHPYPPYADPYAEPYPYPPMPNHPRSQPTPYPDPYPYPPYQNPQQQPYPPVNPGPNPAPSDSGIPNVREISAMADPS